MESIPFKIAEQILAENWKKYCWDWFRISAMDILVKYSGIPYEKAFSMLYITDKTNNSIVDDIFIQIIDNYQAAREFEILTRSYHSMISHKNHVSWAKSIQR